MWLMLAFVACVGAADGAHCKQVELEWSGSLQQCMLFGQQQIAVWLSEHPGHLPVEGYRCLVGRPV